MKGSFRLDIPVPCGEDWAAMLPEEKGRHCQQCCKTVGDFTVMTDQEIVRYFQERSKAGVQAEAGSPGICGRFLPDQLGRELAPAPVQRNGLKGWPLVVAGALTLGQGPDGSRQVKAGLEVRQGEPFAAGTIARAPVDKPRMEEPIVGNTLPRIVEDTILTGKVAVPDSPIMEMGDIAVIVKPDSGEVNKPDVDSPALESPQVALATISERKSEDDAVAGHIVVTGDTVVCAGEFIDKAPGIKIIVDSAVNLLKDTVAAVVDAFRPATKTIGRAALFSVYPNPVIRGGSLHVAWRGEPGTYSLALFGAAGEVMRERVVLVEGKGQVDEWMLPGEMAQGVFFLRAARQGGAATVIKIIVQ